MPWGEKISDDLYKSIYAKLRQSRDPVRDEAYSFIQRLASRIASLEAQVLFYSGMQATSPRDAPARLYVTAGVEIGENGALAVHTLKGDPASEDPGLAHGPLYISADAFIAFRDQRDLANRKRNATNLTDQRLQRRLQQLEGFWQRKVAAERSWARFLSDRFYGRRGEEQPKFEADVAAIEQAMIEKVVTLLSTGGPYERSLIAKVRDLRVGTPDNPHHGSQVGIDR